MWTLFANGSTVFQWDRFSEKSCQNKCFLIFCLTKRGSTLLPGKLEWWSCEKGRLLDVMKQSRHSLNLSYVSMNLELTFSGYLLTDIYTVFFIYWNWKYIALVSWNSFSTVHSEGIRFERVEAAWSKKKCSVKIVFLRLGFNFCTFNLSAIKELETINSQIHWTVWRIQVQIRNNQLPFVLCCTLAGGAFSSMGRVKKLHIWVIFPQKHTFWGKITQMCDFFTWKMK